MHVLILYIKVNNNLAQLTCFSMQSTEVKHFGYGVNLSGGRVTLALILKLSTYTPCHFQILQALDSLEKCTTSCKKCYVIGLSES